jgi:hypothetical protein
MRKVDYWSEMSDAMCGLVDALVKLGITPNQVRQLTAIIRNTNETDQNEPMA